jgi:hypothetical protein
MKFNELTFNISLGMMAIVGLYTLVYSGLTGLLLAASVALIAASMLDSFELITVATVLFVLFYTYFLKGLLRRFEPFQNQQEEARDIVTLLAKMEKNYDQVQQSPAGPCRAPAGVFNPSVEGFANADGSTTPIADGESAMSSPKPTAQAKVGEVDSKLSNQVAETVTAEKKKTDITKTNGGVQPSVTPAGKKEKFTNKDEFQSATGGLFKLGEMPSENKDGPHLDAGQTLVAAMKSLDPNTVSEMTSGTKQLLETQKNLMGMLKSMTPVLAEGRELLSTFSGMFGGAPNNGPGLKF